MNISCEKCNKTFNIKDDLIPEDGRLLQCGSCNHKWFYKIPKKIIESTVILSKKIKEEDFILNNKKDFEESNKIIINKKTSYSKNSPKDQDLKKNNKNPKIIKNTLVFIISIIAFIILLDTFKHQLNNYLPELNSILNNLYESLKDISLFFNDLIN